jgi:hypothetical protein
MVDPRNGFTGVLQTPGRGVPAPGLVYSQTSVPRQDENRVFLDSQASRLKRMKCGTITTARLMTQGLQRGGFRYRAAMLTLTYRPGREWRSGDVAELVRPIRKHLARRGHEFRYTWTAELQERGAVHYHLVTWLPKGVTLPKPDKQGWWPHGMTRIEWARNPVGYLAKYASKGTNGQALPRGLRLHGSGGLDAVQRSIRAWWRLPSWVRDMWGSEHRPVRFPGGGWVSRETGEIVRSRWRFVNVWRGFVVLEWVPEPEAAAGPAGAALAPVPTWASPCPRPAGLTG